MSKTKKIILGSVAVLIFLAGSFIYSVTRRSPTVVTTKDVIFFYGRECPHCQDVEKFLADNNVSQKVYPHTNRGSQLSNFFKSLFSEENNGGEQTENPKIFKSPIGVGVKYDSVEVWHNEENAKLMKEKAKDCGLDEGKIGVPMVYNQGKCYVGTPDIEAFFKQ